jgi:hypothetical protein
MSSCTSARSSGLTVIPVHRCAAVFGRSIDETRCNEVLSIRPRACERLVWQVERFRAAAVSARSASIGEANLDERAFPFIRLNQRATKPRQRGLTEIRGPYYAVMGTRYLSDILETVGEYVDGVKYAGGSFALMPRARVREINDLAHKHNAYVSTGGFIEHVLAHEGAEAVKRYLGECQALGFDVVELSTGFITLPPDDLIALVKTVTGTGLKAKPELGIQFGAGGATEALSSRPKEPATCAG